MTEAVFDRTRALIANTLDKATNDPPTRRALLVGAAGVGVAGLALGASGNGSLVTTVAGDLDPAMARDLGDGFYLVDGWIMTAEDLGLKTSN